MPMQNTNMWNGQNGMGVQGQPMGMRNPNPQMYIPMEQSQSQMQMSVQQNAPQPPTPWESQNWRNYSSSSQPQQSQMPFRGRYISSIDEVVPQEIQMDAYPTFFPTEDMTCIYAKVWTKNGELKTFRFIPEREPTPQVQQADPQVDWSGVFENFASLMDTRYSKLESKVDDLLTLLTPKTTSKGGVKA